MNIYYKPGPQIDGNGEIKEKDDLYYLLQILFLLLKRFTPCNMWMLLWSRVNELKTSQC